VKVERRRRASRGTGRVMPWSNGGGGWARTAAAAEETIVVNRGKWKNTRDEERAGIIYPSLRYLVKTKTSTLGNR